MGVLDREMQGPNAEIINCAAAPTTTTIPVTTTTQPVTPTTQPVTTTTQPTGPLPSGCGFTTPAFCDNFTNESPPAMSRSGPLSAVWGVTRVTNYQNPSQGNIDTWDGVPFRRGE